MEVLVLGASGKTGRLLVSQLLAKQLYVRVIVRSTTDFLALFPNDLSKESRLSVTEANILELSDQALQDQIKPCGAVISCLGHNLNLKGIYGQPRHLVTDSVKRISEIVNNRVEHVPIKFILMNTTGNQNRKEGEKVSFAQHVIICLIRKLIPPHKDNEDAADYLQHHIKKASEKMEWSVVRPDGLIDEPSHSEYDLYFSPIRSAIFDAGKTSRINVAHFMTALVTDSNLWAQWKTKMPVIYNRET
ncbi:SDR family oxidoreductase [Vibrio sp. ZSDE26]|uniref:SDR family oxidoreductase n=1 Tax=Vibrio amylolyticus TaxID=2847292 RepID=A0A9X1XJ26_9VIBR|nr:NAD(P)-binding oxidoreductase [Vibrio amylolyticus]MCK6263849.1 SDR family oxidoreductase [Vibrio amylolyticus]